MSVRFPEEERFPVWKINLLQYTVALGFLAILVGYWHLQVSQTRYYLDLAERNRVRNLPAIAPRGRILDREGRVLVDNSPAFTVLLLREHGTAPTAERLQALARGLRLDPAEIGHLVERAATLPRFQPLVLIPSATLEDIEFIESHRMEFPEIALIEVPQRLYPYHQIAAAALGYVGEVNESMLAKPGTGYRPGDVVGMSGIERSYNSTLSGRDGMRRVIVDSRGREVGSLTSITALPGHDLRLALDIDLQMAGEAALGDQQGAVVALDPRNGEILAMVSHPSFDPNNFARRIDLEGWKALTSDPTKPLMNKAIQAQLAPGSVFKVVTGTAALETGVISPNFMISCPGAVTFYGHVYHDTKGHGSVNFHRALVVSCDVYFYTLGKMLGIEKLDYFARALGLGSNTGIDLPGEDPGLIPSPQWVEKTFKRKWWAGETISVAIGQGAVAVTPLQLAYVLGGLASGGGFHRPHLAFRDQLLAIGLKPLERTERNVDLSPTTLDSVVRGLWGVVNEGGGTGSRARCPGIDIAGKTGTAQVVSAELQKSARNAGYKNNAWFVGFSPSTKPEIVVCALIMRGEHSAITVPVVRDVIKAYYDKKTSRRPGPQPVETELRVLSEVYATPSLESAGTSKNGER